MSASDDNLPAPAEAPQEPNLLRRVDGDRRLLRLARALRARLPGDRSYGDPLSTAGSEPTMLLGRQIASVRPERQSALRELGLGALQVWQALSEAQGRGHGEEELAIMFTDLAGFSSWSLDAGDTLTLELLRRVGKRLEPAILAERGRIVKRLGDGLMAVFPDPVSAFCAAVAAREALGDVEVGGHRPRLRAGIHVGTPRRLGGDYFGVDVNIASRVAESAGPDEILVSDAVRIRLEQEAEEMPVRLRRRWRFKNKGTPRDLHVYVAEPA